MNTEVSLDLKGSVSEGAHTRKGLGYFVLACISLVIAVNLYCASGDFCHQINLHFKRWYLRLRASQKISLS